MELSLESLWSQVLERLQEKLTRPTFETWIKTASAQRLENNCLVICTPNPFARNWLQKYYIKTIIGVVEEILGHAVEVQITVAKENGMTSFNEPEVGWPAPIEPSIPEPPNNRPKPIELNSKYVFSRFVVGANSRMAHAAALAVAV